MKIKYYVFIIIPLILNCKSLAVDLEEYITKEMLNESEYYLKVTNRNKYGKLIKILHDYSAMFQYNNTRYKIDFQTEGGLIKVESVSNKADIRLIHDALKAKGVNVNKNSIFVNQIYKSDDIYLFIFQISECDKLKEDLYELELNFFSGFVLKYKDDFYLPEIRTEPVDIETGRWSSIYIDLIEKKDIINLIIERQYYELIEILQYKIDLKSKSVSLAKVVELGIE